MTGKGLLSWMQPQASSNCGAAVRRKGGERGADRGPSAHFRGDTLKTLSSLYECLSYKISPSSQGYFDGGGNSDLGQAEVPPEQEYSCQARIGQFKN